MKCYNQHRIESPFFTVHFDYVFDIEIQTINRLRILLKKDYDNKNIISMINSFEAVFNNVRFVVTYDSTTEIDLEYKYTPKTVTGRGGVNKPVPVVSKAPTATRMINIGFSGTINKDISTDYIHIGLISTFVEALEDFLNKKLVCIDNLVPGNEYIVEGKVCTYVGKMNHSFHSMTIFKNKTTGECVGVTDMLNVKLR